VKVWNVYGLGTCQSPVADPGGAFACRLVDAEPSEAVSACSTRSGAQAKRPAEVRQAA
jgi:hypothetical protein